nr:uncharacterized protein LOC123769984 [Procambarus clarkii]
MDDQALSVEDLFKAQVPVSCLMPQISNNNVQRKLPTQETTSLGVEPNEINDDKCLHFYGIRLDKNDAFLGNGYLTGSISSLLSNVSSVNNSSVLNESRQNPTVISSPNKSSKQLLALDSDEDTSEPKEILKKKILSNLKSSVAQEMTPPRILCTRNTNLEEAKTPETPYSCGDIIEVCPSPSLFLKEIRCQSSTPLKSKFDEHMNNCFNDENKVPNLLVSQEHCEEKLKKNIYQNTGCEPKLCALNTSRDSNVKEMDSCRKVEDSIACTLIEDNLALTSAMNKSVKWDSTTLSALEANITPVKSLAPEVTGEVDLSESMCNISISDSNVDDRDKVNEEFIILDETSESIDLGSVKDSVSNDHHRLLGENRADSHAILSSEASHSNNAATDRKEKMLDSGGGSKCTGQSSHVPRQNVTKRLSESSGADQALVKPESKVLSEEKLVPEGIYVNEVASSSNKSEMDGMEESVKSYRVPFVSCDPQENEDNEDPKWSYLAKLETDEERYQLSRKLWKSIVVPDPNVNLTYNGSSRRWRAQRNALKDASNTSRARVAQKRKREFEENGVEPPRKRACAVNVNFSSRRFQESMAMVSVNFIEECQTNVRSKGDANKLQRSFNEKIHQLKLASSEVEALHKFYSGLPDQISVSQTYVENEQLEIEQLYTKFRKIYNWNGRAFIP